jgi:hypothetical protein
VTTPFEYIDAPQDPCAADSFVLKVPAGIETKSGLLQALATAGHFPGYFGNNWDALAECLTDFSWIEAPRIVIAHEDLPLRADRVQCRIYLEILRDALDDWAVSPAAAHDANTPDRVGAHELLVRFPAAERNTVAELIAGP